MYGMVSPSSYVHYLYLLALEAAYADVLTLAHRAPDLEDRVQMGIYHDGIRANHGSFHTLTSIISTGNGQDTALHRFVQSWEEVQQSDDAPDLSNGALVLRFTFTLANYQPQNVNHRMGARSKKTMYQREIYDDFYTKTNALKKTPFTANGYCWPMSFLGCQLRRLELTASHNVVSIQETCSETNPKVTELHRIIPITSEEDRMLISTHCPHLISDDHLVLFNPFKTYSRRVNNVYEYELDEAKTIGQLDAWQRAGEIVHQFVQSSQNLPELDVHDFLACGKAYANTFHVWIHILRVECQLEESHSFRPSHFLPNAMDHIYVVFGDNEGNYQHAHAVTNRRKMLYRFHSDNRINVHNYCDICHHVSTQNHTSQTQSFQHITKCVRLFYREGHQSDISQNFSKQEYFEKQLHLTQRYQFYTHDKETYSCGICKESLPKECLKDHTCYIPLPKSVPEKNIPDLKSEPEHPNLWVYDIESAQIPCSEVEDKRYLHVPNCICLRPVYLEGDEDRYYFGNIQSFCEFLLSEKRLHGSTIFAHNGGAYDHQFIIQYLEKNCLPFEALPRSLFCS